MRQIRHSAWLYSSLFSLCNYLKHAASLFVCLFLGLYFYRVKGFSLAFYIVVSYTFLFVISSYLLFELCEMVF